MTEEAKKKMQHGRERGQTQQQKRRKV